MASPIFISTRSEYFSIRIVLRSIELTLSTIYNSLINKEFYTTNNIYLFIKYLKLSVILYILLNGPQLILKVSIQYLSENGFVNFNQFEKLMKFEYFLKYFLNINIFIMSTISFFDQDLETLFLCNLKYQDLKNNQQNFENYLKLSSNYKLDSSKSWSKNVTDLLKFSREFKYFIKRYTNYFFLNCILFLSIEYLPERFTSLILGFISFQTFVDKVGTVLSLILVTILQMSNYHYTVLVITTFYGSWNLAEDLLIYYFNKIHFTTSEQNQWLNTRKGVLFGIGLVYYLLIQRFPLMSFIIYSNAFFNMGYFITKFSGEIPDNSKSLATWCITESLWDGHERFVDNLST
ncbi:uncharacterized protein KGF55_004547 [Candida pseudojiufengensis]|uniref:uncharacterized protein n=1 Tax=Candida pseudojiufengensis TaxID=497109 RepID=UPI002224605B|nr:uncharacterized protein KGF55_004547 [Candida pseudojiufengensis]KAI5960654.1 hypothetical protein KGF55_004547 [Candida pseudojiufengensis]